MSTEAAAILAAGPTCTCHAFPAVHRADLHDDNGRVRDIEMVDSTGWERLKRAHCTRCGWMSDTSWFAEDFVGRSAQTLIADVHRDRWTDACINRPA